MIRNENIICLSTAPWNYLWTRRQRFMNMLAEQNRILYVNIIRSVLAVFRTPELTIELLLKTRVERVKENLFILSTPLGLPLQGYSSLIRRINYFILYKLIKIWQRRLGFQDIIFWTYDPYSVEILRKFRPKLAIYDCIDEHSAYPYPGNKRYLKQREAELCREVDIVFVTARGLLRSKRPFNTNTFFVPNGVDFRHFSKAYYERLESPYDIRNVPKPILGYVGAIADWIDLDLIEYLAKSEPRWSIVMIGPVDNKRCVRRFKNINNLHFLGRKDFKLLPSYIQAFDVCLNPFKLNDLTKTVNPLKVYEYLASGKVIVSTDMPEIYPLKSVVQIASSRKDFLKKVQVALEGNETSALSRLEAVKRYSWEFLLKEICKKIEKRMDSLNRKDIFLRKL